MATNPSSKIELSLSWIPEGFPSLAFTISRSMRSVIPERSVNGATSNREYVDCGAKPDKRLNNLVKSSVSSGSALKIPRSS